MEKNSCFACQRSIQNSNTEMIDNLPDCFKNNLNNLENDIGK